ncbi:putative methyltransferase PMT16 [Trifolium repens]|nr:putative methyltransferase PMT16 [Trifolium repens]
MFTLSIVAGYVLINIFLFLFLTITKNVCCMFDFIPHSRLEEYAELKTCLSHVPEVSNKEETAGGVLENWPQRLEFVSYMEGIPSKAKNLPMNLLLGKLYRISHGRAVVAIYKECLRYVCLQSIGFLLLRTLCRFAIEVRLSKQAAISSWSSTVILLSGKQGSHNCRYCIMRLDNIEEASKDTPGRSFYYAMEPLRHMCLFLQWSLNTMEIAFAIRKLPLTKAKRYLEDVLAHKQAIPFRRFCRGVKGLDVDALYVSHIQVNQAQKQRRPYMSSPCLIELILSEKEEAVQKETKLATNKKSQALRSGA